MAEYIMAYHGGGEMPEDPEAHQAEFMAWIAGLGDAVVNPGTPLGPSRVVTSEGVSEEGGREPDGVLRRQGGQPGGRG